MNRPGPVIHRILTAPVAPGCNRADAHRHWCEHHATIVPAIDDLVGYVQNRPLPQWWDELPFLVCADTWFSSREDERAAYSSPYYRETIVADEERFIDRDRAWHSTVSSVATIKPGPPARLRVLAFGGPPELVGTADGFTRAEHLQLHRPAPGSTEPSLLSAWTDDDRRAEDLARSAGGTAFVAAPSLIVRPPSLGPAGS